MSVRCAQVIAAISLAISGCGATIPRPADLDPGPQPTPAMAEKAARDYLAQSLKDPDSLKQFQLRGVRQQDWQETRRDHWRSGWLVCFDYNAKNSYGGYVGVKRGGIVITAFREEPYVIYVVPEILPWC